MRECNAENPFLLPVRPIAKSFCEVWRLLPYSKFSSAILFAICCLLLFLSYVLTQHVTEMAQDLVFGAIEDRIKRKIVVTLGAWAIQLFVSNSSFFIFRVVLTGMIYGVYELGRDTVFSLLLIILGIATIICGAEYYFANEPLEGFLSEHRIEVIAVIAVWTASIWYWRRYIFKRGGNRMVFDHEVGAALVRLRS